MDDPKFERLMEVLWAVRNEISELKDAFEEVHRCDRCHGNGSIETSVSGEIYRDPCGRCRSTGVMPCR